MIVCFDNSYTDLFILWRTHSIPWLCSMQKVSVEIVALFILILRSDVNKYQVQTKNAGKHCMDKWIRPRCSLNCLALLISALGFAQLIFSTYPESARASSESTFLAKRQELFCKWDSCFPQNEQNSSYTLSIHEIRNCTSRSLFCKQESVTGQPAPIGWLARMLAKAEASPEENKLTQGYVKNLAVLCQSHYNNPN